MSKGQKCREERAPIDEVKPFPLRAQQTPIMHVMNTKKRQLAAPPPPLSDTTKPKSSLPPVSDARSDLLSAIRQGKPPVVGPGSWRLVWAAGLTDWRVDGGPCALPGEWLSLGGERVGLQTSHQSEERLHPKMQRFVFLSTLV